AQGTHFTPLRGKFLSTAEPFARLQRQLERVFAKTAPPMRNRAIFALRSEVCAYVLPEACATTGTIVEKEETQGNFHWPRRAAMISSQQLCSSRFVCGASGRLRWKYKRGNAAWGRKNRHW